MVELGMQVIILWIKGSILFCTVADQDETQFYTDFDAFLLWGIKKP